MAEELGLGRHGVPTDGMMSNLLRRLDTAAFEAALARWAAAWMGREGGRGGRTPTTWEQVAIDGKTLRGGAGAGVRRACTCWRRTPPGWGWCRTGCRRGPTSGRAGRSPPPRALLAGLVLQGKLITGDAIHARRELCRRVVEGGGERSTC